MKIFDISTNELIRNFPNLHNDHIRALNILSEKENFLLVGSYDKRISLLDLRIAEHVNIANSLF